MIFVELFDDADPIQRAAELQLDGVPRIGETVIHGPHEQRWKVVDVVWRDRGPLEVHARREPAR